jgi:dimeric dUTPase (all-alpha-NTP-PPase superfamily)
MVKAHAPIDPEEAFTFCKRNSLISVKLEVLSAAIIKCFNFWDNRYADRWNSTDVSGENIDSIFRVNAVSLSLDSYWFLACPIYESRR